MRTFGIWRGNGDCGNSCLSNNDHFRGTSQCADCSGKAVALAEGRRGSSFPFGGKQEAAGHLRRWQKSIDGRCHGGMKEVD